MFVHGLGWQNDNIGAIPLPGSENKKNYKMKDYKSREGLSATYGGDAGIKRAITRMNEEREKQDDKFKNNMESDTIKSIIQKSMQ